MEYGLIGEKLPHSFSMLIHPQFFGYSYELKELQRAELKAFFEKRDFKGINVTIPYKRDVMEFLDDISQEARKIGAVNTVVNKNGKLIGYNTDCIGLKNLILRCGSIENKTVAVLGSGGTSKTANYVCKTLGAKEIVLVSRNEREGFITYENLKEISEDIEVIINTTPVGMYPDIDSTPINIEDFKNVKILVDAVYNPIKSKLVSKAQGLGIKALGGLYMLVAQAARSAELFCDKALPPQKTDEVYKNLLRDKKNIVLIGMPASGKSSVGRVLEKSLSKPLFDSDSIIEQTENTSISKIFENLGERYFRDKESEIIKKLSKKSGVIISCGGGVILRKENMDFLKQNGKIYFLDRSLENLQAFSDRPLSSDRVSLEKRYNERYHLYREYADKIIDSNGSIDYTANLIKEDFLK